DGNVTVVSDGKALTCTQEAPVLLNFCFAIDCFPPINSCGSVTFVFSDAKHFTLCSGKIQALFFEKVRFYGVFLRFFQYLPRFAMISS
ncbi:MAG: hypothetical protein IKH07_00930, partial [Oscillospiraceae bacterium]|nr:hypothetical protein [Oscillospiraceae bacterium]